MCSGSWLEDMVCMCAHVCTGACTHTYTRNPGIELTGTAPGQGWSFTFGLAWMESDRAGGCLTVQRRYVTWRSKFSREVNL